jgi:hypothetical protein
MEKVKLRRLDMYLLNAFSLQMVAESEGMIHFQEIAEPSSDELSKLDSAIGHADTANVLGVPMNRVNVTLRKGDKAIVAQLSGGRLPEGSTTLPEGFRFKFFLVEVA